VNKKVTSKKFAFAEKHKMPFYFVSAAEGVNVVAAFEHALKLALDNKLNPPDKFMKDLDDMLADVKAFTKMRKDKEGFDDEQEDLFPS
jgi:Rab-like protein 2